jgi:hypothetical protein
MWHIPESRNVHHILTANTRGEELVAEAKEHDY